MTQALADVVGADRTGVRLSPNGDSQGVNDSDPVPLFTAAAARLDQIGIAFLELREPGPDGTFGKHRRAQDLARRSARSFNGAADPQFGFRRPRRARRRSTAAWRTRSPSVGRSSPTPICRGACASGLPLNPDVAATWYSQGPEGYTDYPFVEETVAA